VVILGLPVINPTTQAPSLYVLPGIAIGVTGSAFLMTAVPQGKAGVRRLLQRLMWWRVARNGGQGVASSNLASPTVKYLVRGIFRDSELCQ
jgi:hypothetical protein